MVQGSSRALVPIAKVECNADITNTRVYTQFKASVLSFMKSSSVKGTYFEIVRFRCVLSDTRWSRRSGTLFVAYVDLVKARRVVVSYQLEFRFEAR
jgi:hypothetical protein